jgi:CRP/FNR family transcriptional regulator, cyclic AMP receptor protein
MSRLPGPETPGVLQLTPKGLEALDAITSSATYPKGATLFIEGQDPRGVFILCNGRVKLFGDAAAGKSVIFRIAESGEIVGLPSTLSEKPYEVTAEALEPTQANFIQRDKFLAFLSEHGDATLKVAEMLKRQPGSSVLFVFLRSRSRGTDP